MLANSSFAGKMPARMDSFPLNLISAAIAVYLMWNLVRGLRGREMDVAIPGATPAGLRLYVIGGIGALVILCLEWGGELALGLDQEQSSLPWFAVIGILAAGVVEEVVFRGYVVFRRGGEVAFWLTAIGGSAIFTLLHPYLWDLKSGFPYLRGDLKAWFSGGFVFLNSLWFYALRFRLGNRSESILPCIFAHALSNLGVYLIKAAQGFVVL